MNASGGCPSGAFGMGEFAMGVKSALRGVTTAMAILNTIVTEHGMRRLRVALRATASARTRKLGGDWAAAASATAASDA